LSAEPTVVDATVLNRFAAAERIKALPTALGGPGAVCRSVWDPCEPVGDDEFRSEIARTAAVQRRRADERRRPAADRERARRVAEEYDDLERLHANGNLIVLDLDDEERRLAAQLMSPDHATGLGLPFGLAPSAAGSVTIAVNRDWEMASDDNDAARALSALRPGRSMITAETLLATCA
jgi:hypothetical protein